MAVIDGAAASETRVGTTAPPAASMWSISAGLFHHLGVAAVNRAARVSVVDKCASVDIAVDADGNAGNGFEMILATLKTVDAITAGQDVLVGS
jgi:hypothetical protein